MSVDYCQATGGYNKLVLSPVLIMQDISVIPAWEPAAVLADLAKSPLDQKALKNKLDKLYQISSYNELQYVGEVLQAYAWIRLANDEPLFWKCFADQKSEKWFCEEFVAVAIRYMVICKRFKHLVLMVLTQQIMKEALRLYAHKFDQMDKYPKLNSILRNALEFQKQFFKLNYICDYPLLFPSPTDHDVAKIDVFVSGLKSGDRVDVLKVEPHSKRFCWLPGTIRKVTNLSIHVQPDGDRSSHSLDKRGMCVFPFGRQKEHYEWRMELGVGSMVDLQDSSAWWKSAKVTEKRESESDGDTVQLLLQWESQSDWYSLGDPRIQKHGVFTSNPSSNIVRGVAESYLDDFDDVLLDPTMQSLGVIRPEYSRSTLLMQLINFTQADLKIFDRILQAVEKRQFGIEVTADMVGCVAQLHPLLHRNFANSYLPKLSEALVAYVTKADQQTIRNFSKERFELVNTALTEFLKRIRSAQDRKAACEELQLNLAIRFLQSDFLDRKLYAVAVLTSLLKQSKHRVLKRSTEDLVKWVREKGVMAAIYNEKAHSELISRSADFLQYYLLSQPQPEELAPLLEWSEPILKLLNECYEYLPESFRQTLVARIKQRTNVANKDALDLVKRTAGCESWLLANGGESWVAVVKDKPKRKSIILQVFNSPFLVVDKITREVSELYECKFKSEFFLQLYETGYLPKVLRDDSLNFVRRVQFAAIATEPLVQIKDDLFQALAPYSLRIDDLPVEAQSFFTNILPKMQNKHVAQLFKDNFSTPPQLQSLREAQFAFFRACFLRLNEEQRFIERKVVSAYASAHASKKERKEILTIRANPNQLVGMQELMTIVFGSKDLKVTQNGLEFIGFLFDHLAPELASSVLQFRGAFLENCLTELYSSANQQEKYLRIIEGLLDESEKQGVDAEPSVSALFLTQSLSLRVVDHFNVNKGRLLMEVPASLTLHELRAQIAKHLNAYPHELRLLLGDRILDPRLSGRVIHTLNLTSADLIVQKCVTVEKVAICEADGSLNDKCKAVLRSMFREFSQCGLMSKPQCQKYHQRCVGEVSSQSERKVDKIYEQHDADKDGYLTEQDFISFYEFSAKARENIVWSNFETFGVRNDLQDLRQLEIQYPSSDVLIRHLLFNNAVFMKLLVKLMQAADERLSLVAWQVASRLPLMPQEEFFALELDVSKPLLFRYWLYEVVSSERWELLSSDLLERLLSADIETACIGLRAAIHSPHFEVGTFSRIINNLKKLNAQNALSFHSQVVMDNSLKILEWLLRENEIIRAHYAKLHSEYDPILTAGLVAKNQHIRKMYCEAVQNIVTESAEVNFDIFQPFFRLVYGNFEKCDKSTLSLEYFDLYSRLLEVLKLHPSLLPKLELNWLILTRSMIALFLAHRSTETGLNSPPDQVAQGFLRIIRKLLDPTTVQEHVPLVRFLFQNSLFPESGQNKLKNSKSRHEAYELLYQICAVKDEKGDCPGLQQLFAAGFKSVYKKMSASKATSNYGFSSYFYNYNEARSELGYAGIRNLGCICYMISMLQQLFMTESFRYLVLMADDGQPECQVRKAAKEIDDNLFHQLQVMFANLELTQRQDYTPDQFCFAFKDFEGMPVNVSVQQDAQQFLNLFFDKLETCLKPTPFRTILEDVYGGKTCNRTICSNCNAINQRLQNFYPLSLEVKGYRSIEDSLKKFIQGEVISDYQCDACKKKTDVTKSCLLAQVPNYFIIHLQRMCFNYDKFQNEKINSRWEFPNALNVYNYSLDAQKGQGNSDDYSFTLRGVVLHYGSAEFGHYFSYIKETDARWIEFNDERVREFDPHDIENDCFGGEHWRRESQSAYLLVYEKVKKHPLHLEFENAQQRDDHIAKFKLDESLFKKITEPQEKEKTEPSEDISEITQKEQKTQTQEGESQTSVQTQVKQEKVVLELDLQHIPSFMPENLRDRISKANEQFSFTLNLSNDQFAHFLHRVLSIDPPADLSTEYLELCYECFHLRTLVDQQDNVTLSEWAAKRFKQIIGGHGWEFLKAFGQNWESDILSIERSTRVGIKNLLQCVISDIIRSAETETNPIQKQTLVRRFLQKFTEMLSSEVGKNWTRFRQYFEVWGGLIEESAVVREWCREARMVQRLLDFVLEQYSPFTKGHKKYTLRNMHYGAEFQHPLQVLTLLLKEGYTLSEAEKQCMRHYAFIEKVIKFPTSHYNLVDYLCRGDRPLSEKFAYLLLVEMGKVSQSDEIKPIISSIMRFLQIKDDYQQKRVDWLIGFPQYVQNNKTGSYGAFSVNPEQEAILVFISPVRASPLPQQLVKFKNKAQHVACLLLSLLLQMESDGYLHNIDEWPSLFAFTHPYTFWFEEFVESYYEETRRSFIAKYYTDYGDRLKLLWDGRPGRPFVSAPRFLIGRTASKETVKQMQVSEIIEVQYIDVVSSLLPLNEQNSFLTKRNIKNFAGSQDFKVKLGNSYGGSGFLTMGIDRSNHSSDDEEPLVKQKRTNPFEKVIQANLFRKIAIKNPSYENLLVVAKIRSPGPTPNFEPANVELSFEIKAESMFVLTLKKLQPEEPIGEYTLELKALGHATREGYWPRQIITEVPEERNEDDRDNSDNEQEESSNTWVL